MEGNGDVLVAHGRGIARWAVIFLFLRYVLCFSIRRIWPHGIDPWTAATKVVASGFNVVVAYKALVLYFGPSPSYEQMCDELPESRLEIMGAACGHFVSDMVAMAHDVFGRGVKHEFWMFVHHIYMFAVYVLSPLGPFATWVAEAALVNEVSTPFMHLRWFLLETGYKGRPVAKLNDAAFFFSFFFCRIVYIPFLVFLAWEKSRACEPTAARSSFLTFLRNWFLGNWAAHYCLQLFWFYKIARLAAKAFGAKAKTAPPGRAARSKSD